MSNKEKEGKYSEDEVIDIEPGELLSATEEDIKESMDRLSVFNELNITDKTASLWQYKPASEDEPEIFEEALAKGIFRREGEELIVPTEPKDMRKPALEFFMEKAAGGTSAVCARIFREIGTFLAVTWQETDYILQPEAKERSLFGRLVKVPACFDLISEGSKARVPQLVQYAADSSLANTQLMKQLDAHPVYTVAQFAQAVGALYFGCL